VLDKIAREKKKKASIVHVWAPPSGPDSKVPQSLRKLRAQHVEVRWTMPSFEPSLTTKGFTGVATVEDVVNEAVRLRVRASQSRAEKAMRALGVKAKIEGKKAHSAAPRPPKNEDEDVPTRRDPPRDQA